VVFTLVFIISESTNKRISWTPKKRLSTSPHASCKDASSLCISIIISASKKPSTSSTARLLCKSSSKHFFLLSSFYWIYLKKFLLFIYVSASPLNWMVPLFFWLSPLRLKEKQFPTKNLLLWIFDMQFSY